MKIKKSLNIFNHYHKKINLATIDLFLEIEKEIERIGAKKICDHMGFDRTYLTNTMKRKNRPEVLKNIAEAIIEIEGGE